ncbi:MAG: hypothetical protein V7603_219 [Micromonosporaceae bacterium]
MIPVIDLAEDWTVPDEPERARPPSPRLALVLLSVLLLAALGGAAVPRYGLVSLFAVPIDVGSAHALYGDTLYVSRSDDVRAYRLPAGTLEWSAATAHPVGALIAVAAAGVVLAQYESGDPTGVLAFDARSGRVLWRDERGRLLGALPGPSRALLLHLDEVRAVDVPTGRTIWERPRGLGVGWAMPDMDPLQNAPPRLAFDGGDGVTEVVDASSGAVVARSRLESLWPAGVGVNGTGSVSATTGGFLLAARSVVGGQLFVARQRSASTVLDAYDLGTLAHQWRITLSPAAFFVTGCGEVLCVDGFSSMTGVDPRSGAVLWYTRQWREARPLPGGRLLVSSSVADAPVSIVDSATLRPVLRLAGWFPLPGSAPGSWLVGRDTQGLRTWFAALAPDGHRVRPLGWVRGVQISQCEYRDAYLACPTVHNELQVWQYR